MEFFFIVKIILNPLTTDVILGILLGYFLKLKWYDNCFLRCQREARDANEESQRFKLFWYLKGRLKVLDFCFDSFTKVKIMYNLFGLQL
jgi:hypothetical protein